MSRLISYVLANRQSARKCVVIAVRFERDADIDLISVQDRDEQCVAIPCAAKTILILGGARALPTRPPANGLGEPPPRRLPHSSGRCSHYEPPDHLALCRFASSNVLDGYAAYKEAVCRQNSHETVCLPAALMVCRKVPRTSTAWSRWSKTRNRPVVENRDQGPGSFGGAVGGAELVEQGEEV